MTEEWRPVCGYKGLYEVSDLGRVRSLPRRQKVPLGGYWTRPGRVLKAKDSTHTPPRKMVELHRNGVGRWKNVHVLVLEAFVSRRPKGLLGCHNDGNPANNVLGNLRWDTHAGNMADKLRHGTKLVGDRHPNSKITEGCVDRMRDMRILGCTVQSIADWFGLSRPQTGLILLRKERSYS